MHITMLATCLRAWDLPAACPMGTVATGGCGGHGSCDLLTRLCQHRLWLDCRLVQIVYTDVLCFARQGIHVCTLFAICDLQPDSWQHPHSTIFTHRKHIVIIRTSLHGHAQLATQLSRARLGLAAKHKRLFVLCNQQMLVSGRASPPDRAMTRPPALPLEMTMHSP